jgi:hypothetical protein
MPTNPGPRRERRKRRSKKEDPELKELRKRIKWCQEVVGPDVEVFVYPPLKKPQSRSRPSNSACGKTRKQANNRSLPAAEETQQMHHHESHESDDEPPAMDLPDNEPPAMDLPHNDNEPTAMDLLERGADANHIGPIERGTAAMKYVGLIHKEFDMYPQVSIPCVHALRACACVSVWCVSVSASLCLSVWMGGWVDG